MRSSSSKLEKKLKKCCEWRKCESHSFFSLSWHCLMHLFQLLLRSKHFIIIDEWSQGRVKISKLGSINNFSNSWSTTGTLCFGAKYCSFNQVYPLPCKIFAIAFSSNFVHLQDFTAFQFTVKAPTVWRRFGWKAIQIFRARLRKLAKAVALNRQLAIN